MFLLKICLQKSNLHIYIGLVQITENYQRQKLLSPLTGKNVSWKLRYNENIFEAENFTSFYKKGVGALDELRRTSKIRRISKAKGKNVNKLTETIQYVNKY